MSDKTVRVDIPSMPGYQLVGSTDDVFGIRMEGPGWAWVCEPPKATQEYIADLVTTFAKREPVPFIDLVWNGGTHWTECGNEDTSGWLVEFGGPEPTPPAKLHALQRMTDQPNCFGQSMWRPWE